MSVATTFVKKSRKSKDPPHRLPDWTAPGAAACSSLRERGFWEDVSGRLKVARPGGYSSTDFVLFFVLLFASQLRCGIKEFYAKCRGHRVALGALAERKSFASSASISRFSRWVTDAHCSVDFQTWLLVEAAQVASVMTHPACSTYDTRGNAWQVFEYDPTVTALRQRALPSGDDLPEPERHSGKIAKPGYTGRKRGEVRFSRGVMQHAGSGLWLYSHVDENDAETASAVRPAIAAIGATLDLVGLPRDRVIVRRDGKGGNVPSVYEITSAGFNYLSRCSRYELLEDAEVESLLKRTTWYYVPSSTSGPRKRATDLGMVTLTPAQKSRSADGDELAPLRTRIVVSRFKSERKSGAGLLRDGWQYELFMTDLDPAEWPAPEVVQQFFAHAGQENRFAQEDRELELDRVFSVNRHAQSLITLIGLFVWNLKTALGFAMSPIPVNSPNFLPRNPQVVEKPDELQEESASDCGRDPARVSMSEGDAGSAAAAPQDPEPTRVSKSESRMAGTEAIVRSVEKSAPEGIEGLQLGAMSAGGSQTRSDESTEMERPSQGLCELDWAEAIARLPQGWGRSSDGLGLACPEGKTLAFSTVEPTKPTQRARFRAQRKDCRECKSRMDCGGQNVSPSFTKVVTLPIPDNIAAELHSKGPGRRSTVRVLGAAELRKGVVEALVDADLTRSPYAVTNPRVVPSGLRRIFARACEDVGFSVQVTTTYDNPKRHPALVFSDAERQRRRKTWTERHAWNALPSGARVALSVSNGDSIRPLLGGGG